MLRLIAGFSIVVATAPLSGCLGLTTPKLTGPLTSELDQAHKEQTIVLQVKCELAQGVSQAITEFSRAGPGLGYSADWLNYWAAHVSFQLSAEDRSSINPTATYTNRLGNFLIGGGAEAGSVAKRTERIGLTWSVKELRSENTERPCKSASRIRIQSDLDIAGWIIRKANLARIPGTVDREKLLSPFDVFSYNVTFTSTFSAGVTPSWTFSRFTAGRGGGLFDVTRENADDIVITMGPATKDDFGNYVLDKVADEQRYANLVGQAVGN